MAYLFTSIQKLQRTMKTKHLLALSCLVALSVSAAEPKEDIASAAKRLGKDSYSWKTTTETGNFNSSAEGKADKEGLVSLSMKFGENTTDAYLQSGKGAVKGENGWESLSEISGNAGDQPGPRRFMARMLQNFKAPAVQAAELLDKCKALKKDDATYTGDLTEDAAKDFISFGGRRTGKAPEPKNAKGSVKFWLKDGTLTKYELKLSGTVNFNGDDRDIDRTTTVEIKDVGATKVEVPEEAKKKLS
jgi:hypothetical protein